MSGDSLAIIGIGRLATPTRASGPSVGPEMNRLSVWEGAAILAQSGRIVAAGSRDEVEPLVPEGARVIDAEGALVTPGLVDAHTHLAFVGSRADELELRVGGKTYEQIAASGGGILSTVRKVRAASEDQLVAVGLRHAGWMLRCGTTTAEAKSGYGLSVEHELKQLRAIRRIDEGSPLDLVPTLLALHARPEEFALDPDGYANTVLTELLPVVAEGKWAAYCDAFFEMGYFDEPQIAPVFREAKRLGMGLRLHADQLRDSGAAAFAARIGCATADHLEHANPEAFSAMRAAGVCPVLLPGSVYALGHSRYPQAREMIDAGLPVVLATDFNPGSSPTPSLPAVMSLACLHMRMTPAECLTACTINAAHSLGLRDRGALVPGALADCVIWDAEAVNELPYYFGVELARVAIKRGQIAFAR